MKSPAAVRPTFRGVARELERMLFPRRCMRCGALHRDGVRAWCDRCDGACEPIGSPLCTVCGLPFATPGDEDHRCGACESAPPAFEAHRSWGIYGGALADILRAYKFGRRTHAANSLAALLGAAVEGVRPEALDLVVSVPMSPGRLFVREFNQSALLADRLARRLGLRHDPRALRRTGRRAPQVGLSGRERRENVRGAFAAEAPSKLKGANVLLVDDVFTTGATVGECARILRRAGARGVWAVTVARGGLRDPHDGAAGGEGEHGGA